MNIFLFDLRESKITSSTRQECGVTGEQLWLKINEPTEKDKGKYTIDIFDGKDGLKRVFDLSGQGERDPSISRHAIWNVVCLIVKIENVIYLVVMWDMESLDNNVLVVGPT